MFKGLGNLGNIASIMGSMQQLPERMQQLNDQMKSETVVGSSADGSVTVTMNGVGHVHNVQVDGEPTGADLETAILDATNNAGAAAKQLYAESISQMVSDLDIQVPGLDGMLTQMMGGS